MFSSPNICGIRPSDPSCPCPAPKHQIPLPLESGSPGALVIEATSNLGQCSDTSMLQALSLSPVRTPPVPRPARRHDLVREWRQISTSAGVLSNGDRDVSLPFRERRQISASAGAPRCADRDSLASAPLPVGRERATSLPVGRGGIESLVGAKREEVLLRMGVAPTARALTAGEDAGTRTGEAFHFVDNKECAAFEASGDLIQQDAASWRAMLAAQ
jgi:hypothetical protein